jgi:type II secretory pathway pseudopilin PulG
VVVAIIAILAAMLLPTLNKAREQAKRSQCSANLRQLGVAMHLYCDDWADTFPIYDTDDSHRVLYPYPGIPTIPGQSSKHVMYCPSAANKPIVTLDSDSDRQLGGAFNVGGAAVRPFYCYG